MKFTIMGHKVSLRGIKPPAAKLVQPEKIEKLLAKPAELCIISVGMYQEEQVDVNRGEMLNIERDQLCIEKNQELQVILQQYDDLFEPPTNLPPSRSYDHQIILKDGTSPINIRPYRYPTIQKDEIEKLVDEMLEAGIIRHSTSPYSSPGEEKGWILENVCRLQGTK
ncbi:hypothetical protein T459_23333 [Capsicum annuum]|uniref:Uncharacterized protein n=1 Tax=Capsicum annuum TaxID=4072 RepID=A0A2G2YS14_CAPAN|nr:hypothetical protein FXO37_11826 [Capsicum annuum]PHT72548.1 hypothetical protein T459_23333 [Capsicum annuum]